MSWSLYWAHNDGIGGHSWLSESDLRALEEEMVARGMPWPSDRLPAPGDDWAHIESDDLRSLLEATTPGPTLVVDARLWRDWLAFLEGAAENGGLLIRC